MTAPTVEQEARLAALNVYHGVAAWLLTFDCVDPDDAFGRAVRRWAQRCKWLLIDGYDPNEYELWQACQHAIERAFHPDRVLEEKGFLLPGRPGFH